MIGDCGERDFNVCTYTALVVRGRVDRGLSSAAQMRVIAYERGGLWHDASNGAPTTEADAEATAAAFIASKSNDSPYYGGRVEKRQVKLHRDVQIG